MTFSIVIPAYNDEVLIGNAIQSLHRRRFPRRGHEVIVVDTNSNAGTSNGAWADSVTTERTQGPNAAWSRGYSASGAPCRLPKFGFRSAAGLAPIKWEDMLRFRRTWQRSRGHRIPASRVCKETAEWSLCVDDGRSLSFTPRSKRNGRYY
jgi:cellulose synthase/poly-beta-1,6-N-acetylglucosamine synthase-like glycosyltransferase